MPARFRRYRMWGRSALVAALMTFLVGCVPNPVGPVSTASSYREKATRTLDAVSGSAETAKLASDTELRGGAFSSFTAQVLDDALDGIRTAEDTFETITPPDPEAAALRAPVLDLVVRTRATVGDAIVALASGDQRAFERAAGALEPITRELQEQREKLSEPGQ